MVFIWYSISDSNSYDKALQAGLITVHQLVRDVADCARQTMLTFDLSMPSLLRTAVHMIKDMGSGMTGTFISPAKFTA